MKNKLPVLLLVAFPLIMAPLFVVVGIRNHLLGQQSAGWPTAEGTFTGLKHITPKNRYLVFYAYEVAGVRHENSRVNFQDDKASKREYVRSRKEGERVAVHYNPADPGQSVLQPGGSIGSLVVKLLAGAFCAGLGLFFRSSLKRAASKAAAGSPNEPLKTPS
jgi:hypothetical protein